MLLLCLLLYYPTRTELLDNGDPLDPVYIEWRSILRWLTLTGYQLRQEIRALVYVPCFLMQILRFIQSLLARVNYLECTNRDQMCAVTGCTAVAAGA